MVRVLAPIWGFFTQVKLSLINTIARFASHRRIQWWWCAKFLWPFACIRDFAGVVCGPFHSAFSTKGVKDVCRFCFEEDDYVSSCGWWVQTDKGRAKLMDQVR